MNVNIVNCTNNIVSCRSERTRGYIYSVRVASPYRAQVL